MKKAKRVILVYETVGAT